MPFIKLGNVTMYANKNATEENRQPHFKSDITVNEAIPKGATIGVAGWMNEKGTDKSLFFNISANEEQLKSDKEEDLFPPS
mgnify:CR=1 FL=1